jgi:hypothetical protein
MIDKSCKGSDNMGAKKIQPPQRKDFIELDLKDPSTSMKLRGIREISRSRDVGHFRSLIRVFSEIGCDNRSRPEQLEIVHVIYKIFVALGTFALMELTDALSSTDEKIRGAAAQIIGYVGFRQEIPALLNVLDDESPDVRKFAVRALGRIPFSSDTVEGAVVHALTDSDPAVVQEAIIASGQLKLKESVPHLTTIVERILQDRALSDIEHDQTFFATRALGFIGDRTATPVLLKVLKELVDDEDHVPGLLTFGVIDAIGDLRDPECTKQLVRALRHYQERRFSACDEDVEDGGHDNYMALSEAIDRVNRALYHLDREADGVIVTELTNFLKDHHDGRLSEPNPFDMPRPPMSGRHLFGYMSSDPQEAFPSCLVEVLRARGLPVIDPTMGMLESPYQEVRLYGVQILAGFTTGNKNVIELFENLYANESEDSNIKSVVFTALLDAQPTKTLEVFRENIAKPRRSEINRQETYTISRLGESRLEQVTRLLTGGASDSVKEKALDMLTAFINDVGVLVPPEPKKSQRQYRRRRINYDRNHCR